jgi:autotransporter-associated beta strand protein
VPDGQATFDISNTTEISTDGATLGSIVFNPDASAFKIKQQGNFSITGPGIINNSGTPQNFLLPCGENCTSIGFSGTAIVSGAVTFTTQGNRSGDFARGSAINFYTNSSAGDGTYHNQGGAVGDSIGGAVWFFDSSTAANGTFIIDGGITSGSSSLSFWDNSTAANAVIIANGATTDGVGGGDIYFERGSPSLGNATFICNGGTNGGGGGTMHFPFYSAGNPSTARVKLFGNGTMAVEEAGPAGLDIGSLEGDGIVLLGKRILTVGRNNLDTTFTGRIGIYRVDDNADAPSSLGSLTKIGTGTLTLTGANTYGATTRVATGTLVADNLSGSATGTSSVNVDAGTLGGKGTISGPVTIGTGGGTGAFLAPSVSSTRPARLAITKTLTFKADSTYTYQLNTDNVRADQVIAKGITIESGAQFVFQSIGTSQLTVGTIFTPISNKSAAPIAGSFANLPDGSTVTVGQNNFHVSYEGGDGNDLTLTAVP